MKFAFLIIFQMLCQKSLSSQFYRSDSLLSVSKAITDVVKKFYISQNIKFDLIIYGESSNHINDVIDKITKEFYEENPIRLKHIENVTNWNHLINDSVIFFMKSAADLYKLHYHSFDTYLKLSPDASKKFKFLNYIEEIKNFQDLENVIKEMNNTYLLHTSDLRYFELFITADEKFVNLTANLLYSETKCKIFTPKLLNYFNISSQKWNQKLENFEHFNNFYGCMINFAFPYSEDFYIEDIGRHKLTNEVIARINFQLHYGNPKFGGSLNEIVQILSKIYNFTYHYTCFTYNTTNTGVIFFHTKNYEVLLLNFYRLYASFTNRSLYLHNTLPFTSSEYYYLVSYNDLYNNYEKILFPFDTTTWLMLLFTFGLTFITIFGLQFTSLHIRTIIYGKEVKTPGFNALSIFFGISQVKLPTKFFSRLIWLLFIWFCLMFRTCWQSKMFEFMTTDMRKPLPASIEDLKEMNYTIVLTNFDIALSLHKELTSGKNPSKSIILESQKFFDLYKEVLDGKTAIKYAFFVSISEHLLLNSTYERTLPIMENEKIRKEKSFLLMKNSILTQNLDFVMNRLIPTGVMKFLDDYAFWYIHRKLEVEPDDPRKILSVSDLEFGFVFFLAAAVLAIVVFICELHALFVRRQLRKLLGLYELLRVIRERFRYYHDRCVDGRYFKSNQLVRTPSKDRIYDPRFSGRIVNGEPANIADFPHMLALLDLSWGGFMCGASNINRLWALTAAHCLDLGTPASQINFRGGSTNRVTGGVIFFATQYTLHPSYSRSTLEYDIAIVQIQSDSPMEGHPHVSSIPLPPVCGNNNCCGVCNDVFVTTTGWGRNENGILPQNLVQLTKPIHDRADCNRLWGGIGPSLFCKSAFDGRDTCNGDSGSPLIVGTGASRLQVGLVSFGTEVCGDGTAPSVNVRIEHAGVRNWITQLSGV